MFSGCCTLQVQISYKLIILCNQKINVVIRPNMCFVVFIRLWASSVVFSVYTDPCHIVAIVIVYTRTYIANAKRPCDCSVLCLRPKSSLCSCPNCIFTVRHVMQRMVLLSQFCPYSPSVRLSVRLSDACIVTKLNNALRIF